MHARAVNRKQKDKVSSRYLVSHVVPLNCHAYAPQHSFEKQPQPDLSAKLLWRIRQFFWRKPVGVIKQPQGDSNPCLQAENLTSWAGLDDGALRPLTRPIIDRLTRAVYFLAHSPCNVKQIQEFHTTSC